MGTTRKDAVQEFRVVPEKGLPMARLPALVDDLAKHDPREAGTVELIARLIREDGLIQTGKRGRGAAEMTPDDAAALMIALCVAESPKEAPVRAKTYSNMVPFYYPSFYNLTHLDTNRFDGIIHSQSFIGCLSSVISSARELQALSLVEPDPNGVQGFYNVPASRNISLVQIPGTGFFFAAQIHMPRPEAHIVVQWYEPERSYALNRVCRSFTKVPFEEPGDYDREVITKIDFKTFLRVHHLIFA